MKILLVGDIKGHHRTQLFIEALLKRDMGSDTNFVLSFASPRCYSLNFRANGIFLRIMRRLLNAAVAPLFFLELAVKIPFSHTIYLLAMNHRVYPVVFFINLLWRRRILADPFISVYDAANDRGLTQGNLLELARRKTFPTYLKWLDRLAFTRADHLIYVGTTELKLLADEVGADISRINFTAIPPASAYKMRADPSASEILRICWWGTFTPFHGVETIIDAAEILRQQTDIPFRLDMFGTPKNDVSRYLDMTKDRGLDEVVYIHTDKTFGNGLLEDYLVTHCDIALGNFSTTERSLRAVPTKIIDAFSMELPVITMDSPPLHDYADVENDLFTCRADGRSLAKAIEELVANSDERRRRAQNGYRRYLESFSPQAVKESFIAVFRSIEQ